MKLLFERGSQHFDSFRQIRENQKNLDLLNENDHESFILESKRLKDKLNPHTINIS
jgi:hypothetical protein